MKKNKTSSFLITLAMLFAIGTTACTGNVSTAAGATERPEGWSAETHSNDVSPNYDVVFPDDEVNQITITITPEDWEAMQVNMTELMGEAGSGEGGGGFPGGGQPPTGERPQPGDAPLSEPSEGVTSPENEGQGSMPGGAPPDGNRPGRGEFGGGGFGGGDMTPENPMWVSATIEFEGNVWTHVGVRYKGNSSLTSGWRSGTLKLPLKLDFDEFEDEYPEIDNQRFYGFKQLSLANGFNDSSFLRDAATSLILEEAGLPVARTAYYEVILDYGDGPVSLGLYTMIEVVDDTVVDRFFGSDEGNIYEADGSAASFAASAYDQIEQSFEKENNEGADWGDIEELFEVLHSEQRTTDPAAWRTSLEAVFDVDGFLEWLAISAAIEHWDSYGSMTHNYYLYNNPHTGQITWISWDHNEVMPTDMGGGPGGRSISLDKEEVNDNWPLIRYLLDDPVYYELYLDYLAETIEVSFNPDRMAEIYRSLAELIAPYASADVGEETFNAEVQGLIEYAYQRVQAVDAFLSSVEP